MVLHPFPTIPVRTNAHRSAGRSFDVKHSLCLPIALRHEGLLSGRFCFAFKEDPLRTAGASLVSRETLAEQHRFLDAEARHGGCAQPQHSSVEHVAQR